VTRKEKSCAGQIAIRRLFDLVSDDVMDSTGRRQQPYTYQSRPGRREFFFVAGK
jgi:hypothetical protein